ncbi:MAG: JAB domain-containing protein [Coriobacteriia bacterium]|nr:JAB domain-containing protein [Coriobacteriia bacterium]
MGKSRKRYPNGLAVQHVSTYLVRETSAATSEYVTDPADAARVLREAFDLDHRDREIFAAIALNTKNRVLGVYEVSVGSLNASIVHPRELFKTAVMLSASSVVVGHNHPSGDTTPSGADIQLTRRLVKAGDVLGIEVLDHVIVSHDGTQASLRDAGLM